MIIELDAFTRDAEDRARRVHVISVAGEGRTIAVFPAASVFAAVRRAAREAADPTHDAFLRITLGALERNVVSATVAPRAAVAVAVLLFALHHAIALCQLVSLSRADRTRNRQRPPGAGRPRAALRHRPRRRAADGRRPLAPAQRTPPPAARNAARSSALTAPRPAAGAPAAGRQAKPGPPRKFRFRNTRAPARDVPLSEPPARRPPRRSTFGTSPGRCARQGPWHEHRCKGRRAAAHSRRSPRPTVSPA